MVVGIFIGEANFARLFFVLVFAVVVMHLFCCQAGMTDSLQMMVVLVTAHADLHTDRIVG